MSLSDQRVADPHPKVLVVGSLNLDHIWSVPQLPAPGLTVVAGGVRRDFGGKGANQAVAAAKQGASVAIVGQIGDDGGGRQYLVHLRKEGIDLTGLAVAERAATGAAHIYVDPRGENTIVVDSGANATFAVDSARGLLEKLLPGAMLMLLQLESPLAVIWLALRMARRQGVRCILNASPCQADFVWEAPVDTVVVNEHECRDIFGLNAMQLQAVPSAERRELLGRRQVENLVITCGGEPTVHVSHHGVLQVPAYPVIPLDTVGAGDTFAGALAVRLAEGATWPEAIWHANICAALSTLVSGVQSSIPTREQAEWILAGTCRRPLVRRS